MYVCKCARCLLVLHHVPQVELLGPDNAQLAAGAPLVPGTQYTAELLDPLPPPLHLRPPRHHAFVVGNSHYRHMEELPQCTNDACGMHSLLTKGGYIVTLLLDATLDAYTRAFAAFVRTLAEGDTVVVFFSGHGMQVGYDGYLVPVDGQDSEAGMTCEHACVRVCVYANAGGIGGAKYSPAIHDRSSTSMFGHTYLPPSTWGRVVWELKGEGAR